MKTPLSEYGIGPQKFDELAADFDQRGIKLGEHERLGSRQVREILEPCRGNDH
jgi:hypothetical protein